MNKSVNELEDYFKENSIMISRDQNTIFKSSQIHSCPSTDKTNKMMIFTEFKNGDGSMELKMNMTNEVGVEYTE